jgi:hypothetical protein
VLRFEHFEDGQGGVLVKIAVGTAYGVAGVPGGLRQGAHAAAGNTGEMNFKRFFHVCCLSVMPVLKAKSESWNLWFFSEKGVVRRRGKVHSNPA